MTDELSELKAAQAQMAARIAELEKANKPPPPAPDFGRYQRFDPTANFQMPAETVREMARAVPDSMIRDIAGRDARAPTGPSAQGIIPGSQPLSAIRTGGNGTGWQAPIPLSNPPGVRILDEIMDAQDAVDRHELMMAEARRRALQK
jgi:hypothetical protein